MIHSLRTMLANVDLFEVLATISEPSSRRSTTLSHWPGRVVVRQGSPEPGPQLVVESSAEVSVDGVAGTTMAPGAHFAEISLLDYQPPGPRRPILPRNRPQTRPERDDRPTRPVHRTGLNPGPQGKSIILTRRRDLTSYGYEFQERFTTLGRDAGPNVLGA